MGIMAKKALITGIAGQDAGHLAKILHEKGYEIYGTLRGQLEASHPRYQAVKDEFPYVNVVLADMLDLSALTRAMQEIQPDEVYNLAAISHVGYSFRDPLLTADLTGKGVLNVLEAIRLAEYGADYGARVINHYLRSFPLVAELDPNQLAINAPITTSVRAAVQASRSK